MDPQQSRMFKKIRQGKAVLFLGAGASIAADCPAGDKLAKMIHDEFLPGTPLNTTDLMEVCSEVLDTPAIDRTP